MATLIVGLLACLSGAMMSTVVVYFSWTDSRQASALPRPAPAELRALPPGTRVLISARLPNDVPANPAGLALFYVERQVKAERPTPSSSSQDWELETPPPPRVEMTLEDGEPLIVQLSSNTRFFNSQTVRPAEGGGEGARRYVGYLPGQALSLNATWEGEGLLTAKALYAGRIEDYLAYLSGLPGASFLAGLMCGGIGVILLGLTLLLRVMGK